MIFFRGLYFYSGLFTAMKGISRSSLSLCFVMWVGGVVLFGYFCILECR